MFYQVFLQRDKKWYHTLLRLKYERTDLQQFPHPRSLLRDRCKCDLRSPLCPNPQFCFTPAVMWPQGVKGRNEEAGRVSGEEGVAVVVAMAETWSERCWTVGMWNMFCNITVWIISHKPSNPFGPAWHHRPARTTGLVWLVWDWSGPTPSLQEGGKGVLRVACGSLWKERTWYYMWKLSQERWGDREGTGAASDGATKDWCEGSTGKQDNLLDLWTLH